MKNEVQMGDTLSFTAGADISSGQGVLLGSTLFGVSTTGVDTGEQGEAKIVGVFDLPKDAVAISQWDNAYFTAGGQVTNVATSNTLIGVFTQDDALNNSTGRVRLIPQVA